MSNITMQDVDSIIDYGQGGQSIVSGSPTPGSFVLLTEANASASSFALMVSGTWTGILALEITVDSIYWYPFDATLSGNINALAEISHNCLLQGTIDGNVKMRLRATEGFSGTANISFVSGSGNGNGVSSVSNSTGGSNNFSAQGFTGGNALVSNSAVAIKASAGNLYSIRTAKNTNGGDCFILLYDGLVSNITVGTTIPKMVIAVPSGGYWEEKFTGEAKSSFLTAISVAVVMTTATGGTAPSTPFGIEIGYK